MIKKLFSLALVGVLSFGVFVNVGASRSIVGTLTQHDRNVQGCWGTALGGGRYTVTYNNSTWRCNHLTGGRSDRDGWSLDRKCRSVHGGHGTYPFSGYTYWGGLSCWKIN